MKPAACLLLIVLGVLPGWALGETVRVRSGEHDGFTRLVIDFELKEDWIFGRVAGGFEFRPARADITYRLDRVFDKIGRSRIEDVRDLGDGRLGLGVGCDCHAAVDELSNGKVVLDIVTGPAGAPGTGTDARLPPIEAQATGREAGAATHAVAPQDRAEGPGFVSDRAGLPLTLPRAVPDAAVPGYPLDAMPAGPVAPEGVSVAPTPPEAPLAPPDRFPVAAADPDRAQRIARTEAALLEQLARAAAQGLLDADMGDLEDNVAGATPEPADASPPPPVEPPSPPVTQRGHIAVETVVDRAATARDRSSVDSDGGETCIDPGFFDIANWGEPIENGTDIGAYRSGLITELDVADGAGVATLVRNYIYITFGAEAKALLRRYPEDVDRADLLFVMAEIMDEGHAARAADLVDQITCDGATALWATLAQLELGPGQTINRDAVSMAFGALPAHLRRHLGPGLADALLASGDLDTADLIRAAVARANGMPTSEYDMLAAQFELNAGKVDQATAMLDEVVANGDAVLPEALLQRVEATLAAGGAVPDDIVILLDGLAFQFRGTTTARQMVDAGIRARVSAGAFTAAFEQLDNATAAGLFTPERTRKLREGLYGQMTRDTDDTEFLRLSLPRLKDAAGLPPETRRALARRLLDLGFSGPARRALGQDNAMPGAAERQLLAQAALVENQPAVAIGYLAGLADPEALSLRAEALDMAQDHAGAMSAYEAAGDREKMLQMAWRGGLWPEVAEFDQGPMGAAARLMSGEPARRPDAMTAAVQAGTGQGGEAPPNAGARAGEEDPFRADPADQPALARAQALIAQSEAARKALDALLGEIDAPRETTVPEPDPGF